VTSPESPADDDSAAGVDQLVASIGPRIGAPVINRRDVVLVTGPWMAGVTGVVSALRERLPQHKFVESMQLGPGDSPAAVLFVVSAAAALTESDCALLDAAAEHTDVLVGVVSKIDVHRTWRDVLAANCQTLAAHAPRYGRAPWVGAAAAPDRNSRTRLVRDEIGCGHGTPDSRRLRSVSIATPRAPAGRSG
jgi:hypothetical protein